MAESLSWKDFELHLDNLIPGVILAAGGLAAGISVPSPLRTLPPFVDGAIFVAGSYALGLVSALISRNLLDVLSESGLRALVFSRWVHGDRSDLVTYYRENDPKFDADHKREMSRRRQVVADWNAIYRSALRTTKRPDVDRRRAQGRLVRNLFFPSVLAGVLLGPIAGMAPTAGALCGAIVVCYLYAYAELNNMAEAHDMSAATSLANSGAIPASSTGGTSAPAGVP